MTGNGLEPVVVPAGMRLVPDVPDIDLSRRDLDMIRRQVNVPRNFRAPNDQEVDDFGRYCIARRLNPFDRQCYLAPIGGRWQPLVGVHGRLVIALRTGEVDGMEGPYYCHKREGIERVRPPDWSELWDMDDGNPHAAKFVVYRKNWTRDKFPVGIAPWDLYAYDRDSNGVKSLKKGTLWRENPPLILGYKAITRALDLVFQDVMPPSPKRVDDDPDDETDSYNHGDPAQAPLTRATRPARPEQATADIATFTDTSASVADPTPAAPEPAEFIVPTQDQWTEMRQQIQTRGYRGQPAKRHTEFTRILGRDITDDNQLSRADCERVLAHWRLEDKDGPF